MMDRVLFYHYDASEINVINTSRLKKRELHSVFLLD